MTSCPRCGVQVSETARFCPSCGGGLNEVPSPSDARSSDDRSSELYEVTSPPSDAGAAAQAPTRISATNSATVAGAIPENIAGMLAYLVIPAIVFLIVEPFRRNHFVRFHSLQCLISVGALLAIHIVLGILLKFLPLLILPLYGLLLIAEITLLLLLMFKAYHGEMFKLPYVGTMAEARANLP